MKKINWEKATEVVIYVIAVAVASLIFGFAFEFGKAIFESVF